MTAWLAFILGGLVTYLMRASFILFVGQRELPGFAIRALRYVGPAVFAAIVLPATVGDEGLARFTQPDARLLALAVGAVVMWKTRSMLVTLVVGMIALWVASWLGA